MIAKVGIRPVRLRTIAMPPMRMPSGGTSEPLQVQPDHMVRLMLTGPLQAAVTQGPW